MKFSIKDFFSKWTKSRGNCRFGHIYWRNPYEKLHFLYSFSKQCNKLNVLMSNHSLVIDPDHHVTRKFDSHVEAPKWIVTKF